MSHDATTQEHPVSRSTAQSGSFAQTLTITNTTLVDVSNGALRRGTTVVIEGNRIVNIGPSSPASPPRGQVVDANGLYMIPGLWDMHAHAYFDWPSDFGNDFVLPLFIANGITGIRDMGSDLDAILHARGEVAAHRLVGPRLVVSGPMLDGPHAQYKAAIKIATPEDGRRAVNTLKGRGVDFIKIQSGVPREAYFAIADESKKAGLEFEGHVPDAIRAAEAVAAGQRTFEHLIGIFEASSPDEDTYLSRKYGAGKNPSVNKSLGMFLDRYDPAREANIIRLLAQNTVWQCPTLFWERGQWLVDAIDYTKDPDIAAAAHSWVEKSYPALRASILQDLATDPLAVRIRFVDHELDIVRKLHAAGVPFLAWYRCARWSRCDPGHQPSSRAAAFRRGGLYSTRGVADGYAQSSDVLQEVERLWQHSSRTHRRPRTFAGEPA